MTENILEYTYKTIKNRNNIIYFAEMPNGDKYTLKKVDDLDLYVKINEIVSKAYVAEKEYNMGYITKINDENYIIYPYFELTLDEYEYINRYNTTQTMSVLYRLFKSIKNLYDLGYIYTDLHTGNVVLNATKDPHPFIIDYEHIYTVESPELTFSKFFYVHKNQPKTAETVLTIIINDFIKTYPIYRKNTLEYNILKSKEKTIDEWIQILKTTADFTNEIIFY